MSAIDAIIFDLGNVLVAVDEPRAARRMGERTGKTGEEVERYFRATPYATEFALGKMTKRGFYRQVARELGFDGSYEEFARIWADVFTPIPAMIALAESLRTRLPRLLLSNTNPIHMEYLLEHYPFLAEFDDQILSHEVGMLKPDESIYRLIIERSGLTPGRTLFIDDLSANVDGARRTGLQAIQYQNPDQMRQELTKLGVTGI